MGRIDVSQGKHLTMWRYSDENVYDLESSCAWIAKIAKAPYLETEYISLRDLMNRSDEGNASSQISGQTSCSDIYNKVKETDVDIISLTGKYKGDLIVAGVDLRNRIISITLKNRRRDLIEEIQEAFDLTG